MSPTSKWFGKYAGRFVPSLASLRSWFYPPAQRFEPEFADATRWAEEYAPQGQEDVYALISQFAENQYKFMVDLSEGLDKKADEQLRFMSTIFGAITAAAAAKLITFERPWLALASLIPIGLALVTAMRTRTPQSNATPMSTRDLLAVADLKCKPQRYQIESVVAASYHVATFAMETLTTWKARMLVRSALAFLIAFFLLLLAIIRY